MEINIGEPMPTRVRNSRLVPIVLAFTLVLLVPLQESTNNLGENATSTHNSDFEGDLMSPGQVIPQLHEHHFPKLICQCHMVRRGNSLRGLWNRLAGK